MWSILPFLYFYRACPLKDSQPLTCFGGTLSFAQGHAHKVFDSRRLSGLDCFDGLRLFLYVDDTPSDLELQSMSSHRRTVAKELGPLAAFGDPLSSSLRLAFSRVFGAAAWFCPVCNAFVSDDWEARLSRSRSGVPTTCHAKPYTCAQA